MQILMNDNKEITSFAIVGSLENGFQINDELLPPDFKENFVPSKYIMDEGRIVLNDNYQSMDDKQEPRIPLSSHDDELWTMVANLQVQSMQNSIIAQQALQKVEDIENRGVVDGN